jgi:hypothetical protein
MKKIACLLSAVLMLAGAAQAEILVFSGTSFDVLITDPVPVGTTGSLIGFDLVIRNTTGDSAMNPSGLMAMTNSLGDMGFFGDFHQYDWTMVGITSPDATNATFATALDTHFTFTSTQVVTAVAPAEDSGLAASAEVPAMGVYSFGSFLTGGVALVGGNASTDWTLAHFVVADPGQPLTGGAFGAEGAAVDAFFQIAGQGGSKENLSFSIVPIPEPATMSLLAAGGIAALIRRRK